MARPPTPISPTQLEIARRRSKAGVPMRDVARKHRREGINAINALRALEKQRPSNEIIVTKEQLAEAERQALERFDRYASTRPQSCAHCNRALSIEWATKGETK